LLAVMPPEGFVGENDAIYLLVTTMAAVAAAHVGDRDLAERLLGRLEPFTDMFVLDGFGAVCYGPVSLFVGKAAALLGDRAGAAAHFDRALASIAQMGAPLLEANVRRRLADLDDLADPTDVAVDGPTFLRRGDVWEISFAGQHGRFADSKGLRDIAALLANPGRSVHVLDLVGATSDVAHSSLGPALDPAARQAYEQRIRDLTEDLEEAEANNDAARAERLDDERLRLLGELSRSLGLGGRARPAGSDPAERARKAVGMRIRATIDKLERELPAVGRHLRHAVRTGAFCSYEPEQPLQWRT